MSVRALAASPLGFLIGVSLGALGGGGSILAVPVLVFVAGESPAAATTTSLLVVGVAAVTGAARHWRRHRVRLRAGLEFGLTGIPGSLAGSALNRGLDGDVLLLAFAGLIVVAAWRIVAGCPSCTRVGERAAITDERDEDDALAHVRTRTRIRARTVEVAAVATSVGFLTGLFGVGGGFVIVPALALLLGFSMPQAVGTSLVVVAVNTAVALVARLGGSIDWTTTILFTATTVVGVGAGARIADRLDPAAMQRWFASLLVGVALYTGTRAAVGIW